MLPQPIIVFVIDDAIELVTFHSAYAGTDLLSQRLLMKDKFSHYRV